uniref:Tripartite motif containing 35-28 n=1 Tax=Periophthalmus magnuspinnatus TaxID=409849 RepID=A0A3B3ZUC0_9GOBI
MASRLEEDLTCYICHDLFKDPLVLFCSHSFCKECLENWWKDKPIKTCPVCKRRSSKEAPLNLSLRNLVEQREQREQREQSAAEPPLCTLHSEKLRLFCLDHQQPVCLVCKDSKDHIDHSFIPIEELAEDLREQLRTSIKPLQDKLQVQKLFHIFIYFNAAAYITVQAQHTEAQIREQFKKMHQFLLEEEHTRMKALREEEEQKTRRMKDKMAAVCRDMETVSKTIAETEKQLRATDTSFLLQYRSTVEIMQRCPLVEEPKMEHDALIDQAEHLGNLGFYILRNMEKLVRFYPVVLDPNTRDPELILSEDLSSARRGERQKLPQNPERLNDQRVESSLAFISGTHSWNVEVGENKDWDVGVRGWVQRGQETEVGVWCICFFEDRYQAYSHPDTVMALSVRRRLQRVRVMLDFDRATVTFSDPDTNIDLLTFTDIFTGELTPLLSTRDKTPLKILPKDVTVFYSPTFNRPHLHRLL